jgi:hypothetical protein
MGGAQNKNGQGQNLDVIGAGRHVTDLMSGRKCVLLIARPRVSVPNCERASTVSPI